MSSEVLQHSSNDGNSSLHSVEELNITVLNVMLEMYVHAKYGFADHFRIPSPSQEDEFTVHRTKAERQLNNVSIKTHVWRGRCRMSGHECVCFRISATPDVSGDNTNYVNEFILHALKMYDNVVVTSDRDGMYLIW